MPEPAYTKGMKPTSLLALTLLLPGCALGPGCWPRPPGVWLVEASYNRAHPGDQLFPRCEPQDLAQREAVHPTEPTTWARPPQGFPETFTTGPVVPAPAADLYGVPDLTRPQP